jgi:hypothetical protein
MPLSDTPRYTFTKIEVPDERLVVPFGEAFAIDVALAPDTEWRPDSGTARYGAQEPVSAELNEGRYHFEFPGQQAPGTVHLQIGDARREIEVVPTLRPAAERVLAEIQYPEYLGVAPRTADLRSGGLHTVEGSRVVFRLEASRPLASAKIGPARAEIKEAAAGSKPVAPVAPAKLLPMTVKGTIAESDPIPVDGPAHSIPFSWTDEFGLAVLAFLAHGEDPNYGPYAKNIHKGIEFILSEQSPTNGYIGNSMYNHGFATLALAEAYGMVDDAKIAPALKKAVDLILSAQKRNRLHGWRYTPDSRDADTTVTGCQFVALMAARNAGIPVPQEAFTKALAYLARCRSSSSGGYGYTSSSGAKPTLTAIGVLCLCLAKETNSKAFQKSLAYLADHINYRDRFYPYYFEYYMSQGLFQANEKLWREWNALNIRYLSVIQQPDGSWPGNKGGAFNTAGALLSLALNYRFLPIYEK